MQKAKALKIKKISFVVLICLLAVAVLHITASAIVIRNDPVTSFPWYWAFFFPGLYYVVPLVLVLSVYLVFLFMAKKK